MEKWIRKNKIQGRSAHLPKAPFAQNFDEEEVVQVHPLDFWSHVTFDRSVLFAPFTLHSNAAAATVGIPRDGGDGQGRGQWVLFVLLAVMVEGQNLPDALQLLSILEENK